MTRVDRRILSLIFLSMGVLSRVGYITPFALICVVTSLGLGVHSLSDRPVGPRLPRWGRVALAIGLAATTLYYNGKFDRSVFVPTFGLLAAAILLYSYVPRRGARALALIMAGAATVAGVVVNMRWGFANIDVFHFQQDGAAALLHGQNPYSPIVPSPEIVSPGGGYTLLHLHLPYGPVLPVLELPFRLIGDVRLLHLVAGGITAAAVLELARRAGTLDRSAAVAIAFPFTVGMALFSWVDVISMAGLAVWLVLLRSHPRWATLALFAALGVKPTTLIALVPIFFWSVRARRQIAVASTGVALFALPFVLVTGLSAFYYDVLGVQIAVLPRLDALTLNSFLHAFYLPILPGAVSTLLVALTAILVLRPRPRSYGDLLTGSAILATVSFLVAKWAYFNYYYIPAVLLLLAIAGDGLAVDDPELIRPPLLLGWTIDRLRGTFAHRPVRQRLGEGGLPVGEQAEPAA